MSIYLRWGFTSNPFQQTALEADETGAALLIGRNENLHRLQALLETPPRIPTVEGINGVGKTSLANVATYFLYKRFASQQSSVLYLPCKTRFQLVPGMDSEQFLDDLFAGVARTIIDFKTTILDQSQELEAFTAVRRWLDSPLITSIQGGLSLFNVGANLGGNTSVNTSSGFARGGFRRLVKEWLAEMFQAEDQGGVVCIIDNLELLETSETLRNTLERMRDEFLTVPGIRPILCGANGIILSIVSSPRLAGMLHKPVNLEPIKVQLASEILESRIAAFQVAPGQGYLPITREGFSAIYEALGNNLRSLLHYADEYCIDVGLSQPHPTTDSEKNERLFGWLKRHSEDVFRAADTHLTPRNWELLSLIVAGGGTASPSAFEDYGFNSLQSMRPHTKALEDSHLIIATREENDKRRKSLLVTSNGYIANYARRVREAKMAALEKAAEQAKATQPPVSPTSNPADTSTFPQKYV